MPEPEKSTPQTAQTRPGGIGRALVLPLIVSGVVLLLIIWNLKKIESVLSGDLKPTGEATKYASPKEGSWRFIVSGDSRNCGDVVVPAIAAHSASLYQPSFYWHLGDLRAIYKIDEDMAYAELANGRYLGCENYVKRAWPDFIDHQIAPFGSTPFYLGIGNHELIPPKNNPAGQFTAQFKDWLLAPAIKAQRIEDKDCDNPPTASSAKTGQQLPATQECLVLPRNYYHWIQGGVDFIYLDNASNVFGKDQITWLRERLAMARKNDAVQTVVVGMHEALPKSISSDHAMCDDTKKNDKNYPESCSDGENVYQMLLQFQNARPVKYVYVLASHSHFYMQGIFNARPKAERLQGWIVGTAGAVRYALPKNKPSPDDARTNVYGYLLGTVDQKTGKIDFKFQEVKETDVPGGVMQQYPATLVNWCFAHNSEDSDPHTPETTTNCLPPREPTAPTSTK
jgi:hypothetical protein